MQEYADLLLVSHGSHAEKIHSCMKKKEHQLFVAIVNTARTKSIFISLICLLFEDTLHMISRKEANISLAAQFAHC